LLWDPCDHAFRNLILPLEDCLFPCVREVRERKGRKGEAVDSLTTQRTCPYKT
jgi:hypothetical protein